MSTTQNPIQTAEELGLMRGFPPDPAGNEIDSAFAVLPALGAWLAAAGAQDAP